MSTLYRKYRPKTFNDLLGQNHIKITLENEITSQRLAHAYLFAGPRGIGKTTTARLLARSINCLNRKSNQSEPCGQCQACQEILSGKSLDLIEIDAASHTGVDNVRDNIIENTRFTPTRWKYKVFIIDEAHMLSLAAFNALLKTLEEPPGYVIFILCTTEIHKLPETIISRCQRFDFKKINQADLLKRLKKISNDENIKIDESVLKNIARLSDGSARDAESILGQILTLGSKKITAEMADLVLPRSNIANIVELFAFLSNRKTSQALDLINKLSQEGINFVQYAKEVVEFLRKILLIKVNGRLDIFSSLELTGEMEKSTIDLARNIELSRLIKALNLFMEKEKEIKFSDIPQLPLELAIIEICEDQSVADKDSDDGPDDDKPGAGGKEKRTKISSVNSVGTPDSPVKTKTSLELSQILNLWPEIIKKLRSENQSLAIALKLVEPEKIYDDKLILCCPYDFLSEQIKQVKIKTKIEEVISEFTGQKIIIETSIQAAMDKSDESGSDNSLNPVLETFGGRIVG